MTGPTTPIEFASGAAQARSRLGATEVAIDDGVIARLRATGATVSVEHAERVEHSRDWWPLALSWALEDEVPALAAAVVTPRDPTQVAAVLAVCHDERVPVTATGGRSGVSGASVPVHGGVALDTTALQGIRSLDAVSLVVDVLAGTFGPDLEEELRAQGLTLGHWPQSVALSTVGGWLACRSAGQLSTRYGKIEDMVAGLDVVLADGRAITTGGAPRAAAGPDLDQLFVGSEGTLGIITGARLRLHPAPAAERRSAWSFPSFAAGIGVLRRIVQRGATPAVLRLYDPIEAGRSYGTAGRAALLVLDEGDPVLVEAVMRVVTDECVGADAERLDDGLVEQWLEHRNDVSALQKLTRRGLLVDTMEIAGRWGDLPRIYEATRAAMLAVPHAMVVSAHQSHSYPDGGCLYFSMAANPPADERDATYAALWDAGQRAVLAHGGNLSHHHGVGLNRARFMAEALGGAFDVLVAAKQALDPRGILNPGKLGLPDPYGAVAWP